MSVILATASPLKAEIRLAQAVSQFEAELSSDQKATFRSHKAQVLASAPTPNDVIAVTALIDRRANGKIVGGRCFGPRFYNVLQSVQQFAALGDIIIGGSQNMIACGVWTLVRMTLLMIVTSASYLEKISGLFMAVGRSAPRYQMMASLYPRSKNLQSSLSEYYIVVVNLCHWLLKFTQKSTLGQIVSSLSDSDIKTAETQLATWANSIKEEVVLLSSKKIEEEAQENSRFRAISNRFSETASHRKKLEKNRRVLDACSTYDYETTWKQIRKLGNATVLDKTEEYRNWKSGENSATLVCMGKLGSGKSVLLANAVDDLHLHIQNKKIPVAYFFCRHDIPESLTARTILGSLARQLLRAFPELSTAETFLDENPLGFGIKQVCTLLQQILPSNFRAYFVLDGLDECLLRERQDLIDGLLRLQMKTALLLCISYRLEPDNNSKLKALVDPTIISVPDENSDIQEYIVAELTNCLESGVLSIGNPDLILEIRDALFEGAQGMFLWVSLQLKSLCAEKTDEDIRLSLANLPRNLPETFSRILERSRDHANSYQDRILKLVTVAQRPMKTEELREALSVVPGDTTWNPARLINDMDATLACCGSLLMVDEEELTIRVIHHSAKQFLLSGENTSTSVPFSFKSAHLLMAKIVITYLNYGIFDTQLSTAVIPRMHTTSVPSQILRSSLTSSITRSIALQLLVTRKQPNHDIGKVVADAKNLFKSGSIDEHHFYAYAKSFWYYHTWVISPDSGVIYELLLSTRKKARVSPASLPEYLESPLLWAARYGHEFIVRELLVDTHVIDAEREDSLWAAIRNKHEAVVRLVLKHGRVNLNILNLGETPLTAFATLGNEALVKWMIECGNLDEYLDINATNDNGRTALSCAAMMGHISIVKMLLETGRCNPWLKDLDGGTAFDLAEQMGSYELRDVLSPYKNPVFRITIEDEWGKELNSIEDDERG